MKKSLYLTPWYPANTKPVHKGKYLVKSVFDDVRPFYAWWRGSHWSCGDYTSTYHMVFQDREWRGLKGKAQEK